MSTPDSQHSGPPESHSQWKFNYFRSAMLAELGLLVFIGIFSWSFWHVWCPNGVEQCLGDGGIAPAHYVLLSLLRPFVLTPHAFGIYLAARSFSEFHAIILSAIASTLSTLPVYGLCYLVGRGLVIPWMSYNLPSTLRFIRTQDYKLIFAARLIPIFPFDIVSALCGVFTLSWRRVVWCTFLGILPECIFITMMSAPKVTFLGWTVNAMGLVAGLVMTPLMAFEWHSRKRGRSMWATLLAAYREILEEARMNNQIVRRRDKIDPTKTPVLLIYGFFSSQRTLSVIERQLVVAGFDVLSFNLGGLFGTFFTQGIVESAEYIDVKIKRQMERHGFTKFHIVAHSKGSMVAYWWLLKMGGNKYCDKLVAMASPCAGSYWTYLALITPLGFFWKDMWQMRPGSSFLKSLHNSVIPPNLKIWSLYSPNDKLARGESGQLRPTGGLENFIKIQMPEYGHFDFILRRGPIKEVIKILRDDPNVAKSLDQEDETPLARLSGDDDGADEAG